MGDSSTCVSCTSASACSCKYGERSALQAGYSHGRPVLSDPAFSCNVHCGGRNIHSVGLNIIELAEFMLEDADHVVFRRFDDLQLVHLISLQHKLTDTITDLRNFQEKGQKRGLESALSRLGPLLQSYEDAIGRFERMQRRQSAPKHVLGTLGGLRDEEPTRLPTELQKFDEWNDLMSIATGADKGAIHQFIDSKEFLQRLFTENPEKKRKKFLDLEKGLQNDENTSDDKPSSLHARISSSKRFFKYSEKHVRFTENTLLTAIICALILGPISILPYIPSRPIRLVLIMICVMFAFLVSLLLSRQAQRSNLTIMLTYATILVVFLSDGGATKT